MLLNGQILTGTTTTISTKKGDHLQKTKLMVLALVANTMVAQLLYNSAGQLAVGSQVLLGYLLVSAVCSTLAFTHFDVSTIFQLHDLMALDASIKAEIGAERLIKRGWVVLGSHR